MLGLGWDGRVGFLEMGWGVENCCGEVDGRVRWMGGCGEVGRKVRAVGVRWGRVC